MIPNACPNRNCRSQTWNIPDSELDIIRKTQNCNLLLSSRYRTGITKNVPVLDKYIPKKSEKSTLIVCLECELFFCDDNSLKRHQHRRHHGMCYTCHASNVYVVQVKKTGITVCKNCFESNKDLKK